MINICRSDALDMVRRFWERQAEFVPQANNNTAVVTAFLEGCSAGGLAMLMELMRICDPLTHLELYREFGRLQRECAKRFAL